MELQVGVKVLLKNTNGEILLLKRAVEKYGKINGSWDIPGGRINPGTPLIENLKRELMEETQLSLTSDPKLIAAQDILTWADRHVVRLTYTAYGGGELNLDLSENSEHRWVTFEELAQEDDLDMFLKRLIESRALTGNSWN